MEVFALFSDSRSRFLSIVSFTPSYYYYCGTGCGITLPPLAPAAVVTGGGYTILGGILIS